MSTCGSPPRTATRPRARTPSPRRRRRDRLEITVDELQDGEVSPYLVAGLSVGDQIEVRGPVGRWFVWDPGQSEPVQLIAGGSGVVPLMAMIRAHAASAQPVALPAVVLGPRTRHRLLPGRTRATSGEPDSRLDVTYVYTRRHPPAGRPRPAGWMRTCSRPASSRRSASRSSSCAAPPDSWRRSPIWLLALVTRRDSIKTERFGGTGGQS